LHRGPCGKDKLNTNTLILFGTVHRSHKFFTKPPAVSPIAARGPSSSNSTQRPDSTVAGRRPTQPAGEGRRRRAARARPTQARARPSERPAWPAAWSQEQQQPWRLLQQGGTAMTSKAPGKWWRRPEEELGKEGGGASGHSRGGLKEKERRWQAWLRPWRATVAGR